jgi:hypothetical protein
MLEPSDPIKDLHDREDHLPEHLEHFEPGHQLGHEVEHELAHKPEEVAKDTVRDRLAEEAAHRIKEHGKEGIKKLAKAGGKEAASGLATGAEAGAAGAGAAAGAGTGAAIAGGAATAETGVGAVVAAAGTISLAGKFIKDHKTALIITVPVVFLTLAVGAMLLFTALKPIASTLSANAKYLAPVQQIVDNRGVSMLSRFVTGGSSAVASAPLPETVAASGQPQVLGVTSDGPVTNGPLKNLYDAMKKDGFEKRIKDQFGLEFKSNGAGGGVQIIQNGSVLGTAHDAAQAEKILREKFPDLRRLMDEEIRGWDWAQHTQVARPSKYHFGLPGLAVPGADTARSPAELAGVVKTQIQTILQPGLDGLRSALSCFLSGESCSQDNDATTNITAEEDYQSNEDSSVQKATDEAYKTNNEAITPESNYQTNKLTDTIGQSITKALANDNPAIVMLGWLDLATTIYKGSNEDAYSHVTSDLRTKQAGALYLWNLSAVTQSGVGDVTSQGGSLMFRNYGNIEESQAYNYVAYDDTGRGKAMGEEEKVNSMLPNPMAAYFNAFKNSVAFAPMKLVMEIWYKIRGAAEPIIKLASRFSLATFFSTKFFSSIQGTPVASFIDNLFKLPSKAVLPVCDPADKGYNFFNCMGTGAHAMANYACQRFGCAPITLAQENELKYASQNSLAATVANLPLQKRLFDPMQPGSFINVATLRSPVSAGVGNNLASAIRGVFAAVWSTPKSVASMAAQPAMAASADSSVIDGIEHIGIPLNVLTSAPLSQELFTNSGTCPSLPEDQINLCRADFSTMSSWFARYTHNPAYGG